MSGLPDAAIFLHLTRLGVDGHFTADRPVRLVGVRAEFAGAVST